MHVGPLLCCDRNPIAECFDCQAMFMYMHVAPLLGCDLNPIAECFYCQYCFKKRCATM